MWKKIVCLVLIALSLASCSEEKQHFAYTSDDVYAAWQKDGEHAPLVEYVREACQNQKVKTMQSPACKVYKLVESRIEAINTLKHTK